MAIFFDIREGATVGDLASLEGCELPDGGADRQVTSVGPIEDAEPGALSFLSNPRYLKHVETSGADFIVCDPRTAPKVPSGKVRIVAPDPYRAYARMLAYLFPRAATPVSATGETGISPGAFVHGKAKVAPSAVLEHAAVVGEGAQVGEGVRVLAGAVIGPGVQIGAHSIIGIGATVLHAKLGERCIIHTGVRIGADGFGFAMGPQGHRKLPQIGGVEIGDDVEIGANTTIDRGANRATRIGAGTKIDNLVQIGHNVSIGRNCIIVSQTGIAGSATLDDFVVLGGKAAVNGHVHIHQGAQIAGLSGVSEDVPPGVQYGGVPARPIRHWMREIAATRKDARRMENKT